MSWFLLYTDGSCINNPGAGGYAAVVVDGNENKALRILQGGEIETTNNRMEMRAVIEGLNSLDAGSRVRIVTDSEYVLKGFTEWLPKWKLRDFKTKAKQPVKNVDLWYAIDLAVGRHKEVAWKWVRGHTGNRWNEMAHLNAEGEALRQDALVPR